jgi:hypothetical protein
MSRGQIVADIRDEEKRGLTVDGLVDRITGAGGVVSDRALLRDDTMTERLS